MRSTALRRLAPAAMVAATILISACGSSTPSAPVTVVQNVTVEQAPVSVPALTTSSPASVTPPPTTSSPSPSSSSSSSTSSPEPTTPSTSAVAVVPALVVRPPDDPDTPGPVGGTACSADPAYFDEASTGMAADAEAAWVAAVAAAAQDGIVLCLHDGKRSAAQQQAQYDDYAAQYGAEVADQLVLPWEKSAHVTGYAVDVHPATAFSWLQSDNGALGWCRIYDNEPWHFEFAEEYRTGCPARLPKPER